MTRIFLLFVLLLVLLAPFTVLAQDETVPSSEGSTIVTPEEGATRLISLLLEIIEIPFAGTVILFVAVGFQWVQSKLFGYVYFGRELLAIALAALVWAAYWFATRAGYGLQFEGFFEMVTVLLKALQPYIGGFVFTAATAVYLNRRAEPVKVAMLAAPRK